MSVTQVVEAQIEAVRRNIPKYYETSRQLAGLIEKTDKVEQVNRKLYRIPVETRPGGAFAKYSADSGSLGSGTSFNVSKLTAGYFYSRVAWKLTQEQVDTTQSSERSVVNAWQKSIAEAIITAQVMDDISLHTDGSGQLTAAATAEGDDDLTFTIGAADPWGVGRLREGMEVEVWDSAGSTLRAGATGRPIIINAINYTTQNVLFNQTITSLAATDLIAFAGMTAYGPAALTTQSSTWPATGAAAGLGGDSFRHGIYYVNDNDSSKYYLGVLKSALPQLLPASVNANSNALTYTHGLQLKDQLFQRWDADAVKGLIGIAHMKQREQLINIGITIANKDISGDRYGRILDLLPTNHDYMDTFEYCGIPCYVSKRQSRTRFDFINPMQWGRAEVAPLDFWKLPGSNNYVFEGRDGSGNILAEYHFFLRSACDYVCFNPGQSAYIYGLTIPS